jgi:hypothetical protein
MTYVTVSAELRHQLGYSVCRILLSCDYHVLKEIVVIFYISCRERIYFFSFYLERKFNNGVYAMEVCIKVHELVL